MIILKLHVNKLSFVSCMQLAGLVSCLRPVFRSDWSDIVPDPCLWPVLSQVRDCLRPCSLTCHSVRDKPSTPKGCCEACHMVTTTYREVGSEIEQPRPCSLGGARRLWVLPRAALLLLKKRCTSTQPSLAGPWHEREGSSSLGLIKIE